MLQSLMYWRRAAMMVIYVTSVTQVFWLQFFLGTLQYNNTSFSETELSILKLWFQAWLSQLNSSLKLKWDCLCSLPSASLSCLCSSSFGKSSTVLTNYVPFWKGVVTKPAQCNGGKSKYGVWPPSNSAKPSHCCTLVLHTHAEAVTKLFKFLPLEGQGSSPSFPTHSWFSLCHYICFQSLATTHSWFNLKENTFSVSFLWN